MAREVKFIVSASDKASKVLNKVSDRVENLESGVKKSSSSIKDFAERNEAMFQNMAVGGAAAGAAIVAMANSFKNSATSLNESINAVNVVFGEGADIIHEFGETAATSVGLAQSEFNQLATRSAAQLNTLGLSQEEVAKQTVDMAKRAADLASVYNTDVSEALDAMNAALRGEGEAIERFGGSVSVAEMETYALSQGIMESVNTMTEQEKKMLRLQMIFDQTSIVQGDFINTQNSLANQQKRLNAELQNLSATIGTALIPIFKEVVSTIRPVVQAVTEWARENPELVKNIILGAAALSALIAVLGTVGLAIGKVIAFVKGMGAVFAFLKGAVAVATGIIGGLTLPIAAVIAAVVGLGVVIYKNWNAIVDATAGLRKGIFIVFTSIIKFIGKRGKKLGGLISKTFSNIWDTIKKVFGSILSGSREQLGKLSDFRYNVFQGFARIVQNVLPGVYKFVVKQLNRIRNAFSVSAKEVSDSGDLASNGFVKNMRKGFSKFQNVRDKYVGKMQKLAQRMEEQGNTAGLDTGDSLMEGLNISAPKVGQAAKNLAEEIRRPLDIESGYQGPISESSKWMPALIEKLSGALQRSKDKIRNASDEVAEALATGLKRFIDSNIDARVGEKFDQINHSINDYKNKASQELSQAEIDFINFSGSVQDTLNQLERDYRSQMSSIRQQNRDLTKEMQDLQSSFQEQQGGDKLGLAKAFVEQEELVAKISEDVKKKQEDIASATSSANRQRLEGDLVNLQNKLIREQEALANNAFIEKQFVKEIAEARRLAEMTSFERFVEQTQKRMNQREQEFKANIDRINKEKAALIEQQLSARIEYESSREAIKKTLKQQTKFFIDQINKQELVTKEQTDKMARHYNQVTQSIERMLRAQARASMGGGVAFANGGVAPGGFRAFANGGMVTKPTLGLVGEGRYNEAIVPLPDGRSIPVQMNGGGGGGSINLYVSGNFYGDDDEFADKIGNTIIEKFTQADQGNFMRY